MRERLNIRGLILEPEQGPKTDSQRHWEKLKSGPLFDQEHNQWRRSLDEHQQIENRNRPATAQLLGIWVESEFDLPGARLHYGQLKKTALWDGPREQWLQSIHEDQKYPTKSRHSTAQLLGVVVEYDFNPAAARQRYEVLKKTELYSQLKHLWRESIKDDQTPRGIAYRSDAQLFSVFAEGLFNREEAARRYHFLLSQKSFLNPDSGLWKAEVRIRHEDEALYCSDGSHPAKAQLAGILAASWFDYDGAGRRFAQLQDGVLYDKEQQQWREGFNPKRNTIRELRTAEAQLLGILCERLFEVRSCHASYTPPMPSSRKF